MASIGSPTEEVHGSIGEAHIDSHSPYLFSEVPVEEQSWGDAARADVLREHVQGTIEGMLHRAPPE